MSSYISFFAYFLHDILFTTTTTGCKYSCVYASKCLHTFPFSPTSSTTSYSPLSVTTTACKYYCVYASMSSYISFFTYFLHDILFTTTTTGCKYSCVYASKCLHTFPFSPTSSTTSYSPLSVTTTACKYYCVYASMSSYISFFAYFLHDILFTTICHNNSL